MTSPETKSDARVVLLLVLPLLLILPFALSALAGLGAVEMYICLALLAAWGIAFAIWGRRRRPSTV